MPQHADGFREEWPSKSGKGGDDETGPAHGEGNTPVARHGGVCTAPGQEREQAPGNRGEQRGGLQGEYPEGLALWRQRVGQKAVDEEGFHREGDHARREHDLA